MGFVLGFVYCVSWVYIGFVMELYRVCIWFVLGCMQGLYGLYHGCYIGLV